MLDVHPRVSVLMTVFNAEDHLRETLDSLSAQEFQDFEVVVLEHGSTDCSLDVLRAWGDHRIVLKTLTSNIGRTPALNDCLSRAKGEYIAILDADDLAHPRRLAAEVQFLNGNSQVGLVGTWSQYVDDNNCKVGSSRPPVSHDKLIKQLAVRDPLVHSSVMFRRNIAIEIGGYDPLFVYAQDFNLIIEFAKLSKIAVIDEELCTWRQASSSLTSSNDLKIVRAFDEYRLFKKVSTDLNLGVLSQLLNLKQRILTTLILKVVLLRSKNFNSIRNLRL
jgi:glycosyltransferase involved in cell wall biosynthesis